MPMQTTQTGSDDPQIPGGNLEKPAVLQNEQPPINKQEDISGIRADNEAIKAAQAANKIEIHDVEGTVFKTLRQVKDDVLPTRPNPENEIKIEVEGAMSDGLVKVDKKTGELSGPYTELPADRQQLLKVEGERLANEFDEMMRSGKFDPKIVQMDLKQWLKIIPGVNQPWLEQEATIKKDKIVNLYNQIKRDSTMLN